MKVLVTGGAGYIGSHTCKLLAASGHQPIVFDNLVTGHAEFVRYGPFVRGDLGDPAALRDALTRFRPDAVVHFAASAYVGESMADPRKYYCNNVVGTLNLLDAMRAADVFKLVFSSSCATYGIPDRVPIAEDMPQAPINPYGRTKLIGEQMMRDMAAAEGLSCIALRYFNAAGAALAGDLGELHDPETHVVPLILGAIANGAGFNILGGDHPTPDGSCIRDYLHVEDLARAHLMALQALPDRGSFEALNLGTGVGISVRELTKAAERVTGRSLSCNVAPARAGDPPVLVADPRRATLRIGWAAESSDIDVILETAWRWMHRAHA